jgi:superfamily II DNA or RNA helicase
MPAIEILRWRDKAVIAAEVLDAIRQHSRLKGYLEAGAPRGYLLIRQRSDPHRFVQRCEELGLTATLVREDGREDDLFALIGPKKVDIPWKELERQGWIATAQCHEVRIPMPESLRMDYAVAAPRDKFRIAAENPLKPEIVRQVLSYHPDAQTLIIGMYVEQLRQLSEQLEIP